VQIAEFINQGGSMRIRNISIIFIALILILWNSSITEAASKYAAKVNGKAVKNITLEAAVNNFVENQKLMGVVFNEEDKDKLRSDILQELISAELLYQQSKKAKLPNMKEEVNKQLGNIKDAFTSDKEFKEVLKDRGISEKDLKEDIKKGVYIKAFLDKEVYINIVVTEKEKQEEFEKNKDKLKVDEQVRAAHILISFPENATKEQKKVAKEKVNELRKKALAGEDFAKLAKENSHDTTSAARGGNLGYFEKGVMVPEFEKAVFSLKKDQISNVVETKYGYHIIKLFDKKAPRKLNYEEVASGISRFIANNKKNEKLEKFVETLRETAKIKIY